MSHYTDNRYLYCASEMFSAACLKIAQAHPGVTVGMLSSFAAQMRSSARSHTRLNTETPGQGWDVSASIDAAIADAIEKHLAATVPPKDFDATEVVR